MDNKLQEMFDSVECGCRYEFGLTWASSKDVKFREYEILAKKKHTDYSYSFFCRENNKVGYLWLLPSWRVDFTQRVCSLERV